MSAMLYDNEIRKLVERLEELRIQLRKDIDEQDDACLIVENAKRKKEEIDEGIRRSMDQILQRVNAVDGATRFKELYLNQTKQIMKGQQTEKVFAEIDEGIRRSQKRNMELEQEISSIKQEIRSIEQQIDVLRVKAVETDQTTEENVS